MRDIALLNLAGVQAERGRPRQALPLIAASGRLWVYLDHLASMVLQLGHMGNAARLLGCADVQYAERKLMRQGRVAHARDRVGAALAAALADDTLHRLLQEGAALSDHQAALVLG